MSQTKELYFTTPSDVSRLHPMFTKEDIGRFITLGLIKGRKTYKGVDVDLDSVANLEKYILLLKSPINPSKFLPIVLI